MNERISQIRKFFITDRKQKKYRCSLNWDELIDKESFYSLTDAEKMTLVLETMLENEEPVVFGFDRIPFIRTVTNFPYELFAPVSAAKPMHENGMLSNICVDIISLAGAGFDNKIKEISDRQARESDPAKILYLECMKRSLTAVLKLVARYREKAEEQGNSYVADLLSRVPAKAPETLAEALACVRIVHYVMWCTGCYHNTLGRFDVYMYKYYSHDIEKGIVTDGEALELIEEFFLSCNKDSDLYIGVQQGDNGQSIALGGRDENGTSAYTRLSELCLTASLKLKLIDPKINLRVDKNTPMSVYELGTELTKTGLGFPQYLNDDTNIKALTGWGYEPKDACNYSAAACWELIIPGRGMEIVNIAGVSFAGAAEKAVRERLANAASFDEILETAERDIDGQINAICERTKGIYIIPAPFHSIMMEGCIEKARDCTEGCRYNNYGVHGAGIATAADSLAAIKKYVFDEKSMTSGELLKALADNFDGHDILFHKLRYDAPKMGRDGEADDIAKELLDHFANSLSTKQNDRGGIYRAGTGSAMFYLKFGENLPATADGRKASEPVPANYSPSLFTRTSGPVSVIMSFTKPDLSKVANGGPLTLELHDTMFRNHDAVAKTAYLVKSYIDRGGHEIQLNAVNRDMMLDAQKHPENYRNLIVRVWGWSGYFVELDKEYQDHIISRCEFTL